MIVMDASAMVEALVGREAEVELLEHLTGDVFVPHLLDVEVLSALRGLALGRTLSLRAADQARAYYFDLTLHRQEAASLEDRIWQLRNQFTSYDACYLALAEALDLPLATCDRKLLTVGHGAQVLLYPRSP